MIGNQTAAVRRGPCSNPGGSLPSHVGVAHSRRLAMPTLPVPRARARTGQSVDEHKLSSVARTDVRAEGRFAEGDPTTGANSWQFVGRLLFLEGHLRDNGGLRVSHSLAVSLTALGLPVEFFVLERVDDGSPLLRPDPSLVLTFGSFRLQRFRISIWRIVGRLLAASRRSDVVVSGSETGNGLLVGWFCARLTRRPFVLLVQAVPSQSVNAWVHPRLQSLTRWVHRHVDLALCVSAALVPEVVANGLAPQRVQVLPVGIDFGKVRLQALSPSDQVGRLTNDGLPYIVAVGRLVTQKGFDILLRAHATALHDGAPHRLVIVGDGPDGAALRHQAAALGVSQSVVFLGHVDNPQPVMAAASLFVLSSRYEGMGGLVLLEAQAHGLPIVATDCESGPREVLRGGELGDLVPVDDAGSLAAAIESHLRNPARLLAKGCGGPDRARKGSPDATAAHFLRTLNDMMMARQSRPRRHGEAAKLGSTADHVM
jgi:glycosyltransferase involved in cell wall biosynthesis